MKSILCSLIVGAALALCSVAVRSQAPQQHREQTVFSAEDANVKNPVSIPNKVLAILRSDDRVKNELEYSGIAPENLPTSWFSASEIVLGSSGEKDLIVAAEGPLVGQMLTLFGSLFIDERSTRLCLRFPR